MSQRSEIVGIQYLRGLSALAVVADHTSQMAAFPKYFGRTVLGGALQYFGAGVDIFFVISGFIITIVALQGENLVPSLNLRSFFSKRFARIVPLMWLAIAAFLILRMAGTQTAITPMTYITAALLIPFGDVEPNHIWTLRHEFVFYVIFAISFLGPRPMRWLIWLWLGASIVGSAAVLGPHGNMSDTSPLGIIFSPVNVEFGAGMLVGIIWLRWPQKSDVQTVVDPFVLMSALSLAVIAWVGLTGADRSIANMLMLSVLSGGLIWFAARISCPDNRLSAFGRILGNSSYALYLFHPPLVAASLVVTSRLAPGSVAVAIPMIVTAVTGVCVVIHMTVEKTLVRQVQKLLAPKPSIPPIVVRSL